MKKLLFIFMLTLIISCRSSENISYKKLTKDDVVFIKAGEKELKQITKLNKN